MSRPLLSLAIVRLEEMFARSMTDRKVLIRLQEELEHRTVPRAVALLTKVKSAMKSIPASSVGVNDEVPLPNEPDKQPDLWGAGSTRAVPARIEPKMPASKTIMVVGSAKTNPAPSAFSDVVEMSVDEAYRVLKVTPSSTWEGVEFARRMLVQLAHPDSLARLSVDQQDAATTKAKKANRACSVIQLARCHWG